MCTKLSLFLVMVASASACSSSGWNASESDPSTLVGTWRQIPFNAQSTTPLDQLGVATFGSDGTFTYNDGEGDPTQMQTYTADRSWLTTTVMDPQNGVSVDRQTYVATSANLMIGGMYPMGDVDGVIGSWHGEERITTSRGTGTITDDFDIRADHTLTEKLAGAGSDQTNVGTWQLDGTDLVVSYGNTSDSLTETYQQVPGVAALGGELFGRQ